MAGGILGTAVSGLLASQRALTTVSHNISNVNTPGYSRQRVEFGTRAPSFIGVGFIGNGVTIESITRLFDQTVINQLRTNTSLSAQLATFHEFSKQIDNLLADPDAGLSPALQGFFDSVQGVSDDPSSIPARQVMLNEAQSLTSRFDFLSTRIKDLGSSVNSQITNAVASINSLASSIANINQDIAVASSGGQPPNDLLDQRDELVRQLSEFVSVNAVQQASGDLNLSVGNGISLVNGSTVNLMSTTGSEFDPTRLEIVVGAASGNAVNVTNSISGGLIGGVLDFRQAMLDPTVNELGQIAIALADSFNDQHQLGQDLNGQLGGLFFNDIAATSPQAFPSVNNGGNATLSVDITDSSTLTANDYLLSFDGAAYTLTNTETNVSTALVGFPAPTTVDGVTFDIAAGAMNAGDRILIRPTYNAASNIALQINNADQIAAAAPVRSTASIGNFGNATISQPVVNAPPPTDANLQQNVTITFNTPPTTFNVVGVGTGDPVGVGFVSGGNITFNGFTTQINGLPQAGDVFTIESNIGATSDNRNALLLADVQTLQTVNGVADLQTAYAQVVAGVGTQTHQAGINRTAQDILLDQSIEARETISGVNLDEEAANLIKFQQAYQANAQVIVTINTIFQTLINAVGR